MKTTLRDALARLVADLPADSAVSVRVDHLRELLAGLEPAAPPRLVDRTCAEVALLMNRKASTIRGWCDLGLLPGAYRLHGREWRIPEAAVTALNAKAPHRSSQPTPRVDLGGWRNQGAS